MNLSATQRSFHLRNGDVDHYFKVGESQPPIFWLSHRDHVLMAEIPHHASRSFIMVICDKYFLNLRNAKYCCMKKCAGLARLVKLQHHVLQPICRFDKTFSSIEVRNTRCYCTIQQDGRRSNTAPQLPGQRQENKDERSLAQMKNGASFTELTRVDEQRRYDCCSDAEQAANCLDPSWPILPSVLIDLDFDRPSQPRHSYAYCKAKEHGKYVNNVDWSSLHPCVPKGISSILDAGRC